MGMNLLLVGVGGVGCEILILLEEYSKVKGLPFTNIVIVDDDVVEESNLNRQRLFTKADIARPKVQAASEALKAIKVVPLKVKVDSIGDMDFFRQFDRIVLAVDNLETRRWMNSTIFQASKSGFILVDLGVEGFKFSVRVVKANSACIECTMDLFTAAEDEFETKIPICSIYGTPRNLNDCIYWSLNKFKLTPAMGRIESIFDLVKERADEFGIDCKDLTFNLIQSMMKRAIPAVASINSLLAGKGLEILLEAEGLESNFWFTNLENGIYEFETILEKGNECFICN